MNTGHSIYKENLEASYSRKKALDKIEDLSDNICWHLVKILTIHDPEAEGHWIAETNAWLRKVTGYVVKVKSALRTDDVMKRLYQYKKGDAWFAVRDYMESPNNSKQQSALVYKGHSTACAFIYGILDEIVSAPEAFSRSRGLAYLSKFKEASKKRGAYYKITLDELYDIEEL